MDHPVRVRAPGFLGGGVAPAVLRRLDPRFVEGLFEDLVDERARRSIGDREVLPRPGEPERELYLPCHRVANLVLVEVDCDVPGNPRIDPTKLDGAGIVVRRRRPLRDPRAKPVKKKNVPRDAPERWMLAKGAILGWRRVASQLDADEDPEQKRRPTLSAGHPAVDRLLRRPAPESDEQVTRLYLAPPDVCEALGRTLLFAVLPVADADVAQASVAEGGSAGTDSEAIRPLLPFWLRRLSAAPTIPSDLAGHAFRVVNHGTEARPKLVVLRRLDGGSGEAAFEVPEAWTIAPDDALSDMKHFVRMLWQVQVELGASGGSSAAKGLRSVLDGVKLDVPDAAQIKLGAWIEAAAKVFLFRAPGSGVRVPRVWPRLSDATAQAVQDAVYRALQARAQQFGGDEGRFADHDARYEIRAFVRIRCPHGCPSKIFWSDPTPLHRVARWYESGPEGAIVPQVELPAINRRFLENLKPNVAFKVPKGLFNLIRNNTPGDLLEGKGSDDDSGPDLHWICGFNIPIITICAFIMLIIMLSLLNIIFWWLPFVKICIPLPGQLARVFNPEESE